jgi:hypothetical protein
MGRTKQNPSLLAQFRRDLVAKMADDAALIRATPVGTDKLVHQKKKPGFRPAFYMDARVKPERDAERSVPHNTRLLSFTFSASKYTLDPISLNLALIVAMPSSMVPDTDIPTPAGSFSVAA